MTAPPTQRRPWYCNDRLTEDYRRVHREGGDLKMLKALKIVRAIVVNLGMIGIAALALTEGAEATIVGSIGLVSLAAYNGVEIVDYTALAQALLEVSGEGDDADD